MGILKYNIRHIWFKPHAFDKIKTLKNSKKGASAFVFANGPSLKKLNAEKVNKYLLHGFDLFAINSYITTKFAQIAPPTHYILSDPAHFGKADYLMPQQILQIRKDMNRILAMKIPLFCPLGLSNFVYHDLYAFNDSENLFTSNFSDVTKPRGYPTMTAYKALSIACYMGYDKIYICGIDNDYFKSLIVDENNELYYTDNHFFDNNENRINESNSIEGPLYKVNKKLESDSIGHLLYVHHFLFKQLEKFNKYEIINLDKNSLVDVFSKHHNLDIYQF